VKTGRVKQTVSLVRKREGPTAILKVEGRSSRVKRAKNVQPCLRAANTGREPVNTGSVYRPTAHRAIFDAGES